MEFVLGVSLNRLQLVIFTGEESFMLARNCLIRLINSPLEIGEWKFVDWPHGLSRSAVNLGLATEF